MELMSSYETYRKMFTDGTKGIGYVGCAAVGQSFKFVRRINPYTSIFTAELFGLIMAVNKLTKHKYKKIYYFV